MAVVSKPWWAVLAAVATPCFESNMAYEPTPEEIRQRCLEIQETWTEAERLKRAGTSKPQEWQAPWLSDVSEAERS